MRNRQDDDDDCLECLYSSAATGVRLTIEITTRVVYGILGLVSLIAFWRAPAFLHAVQQSNEWESLCSENIRYLFLDAFTIPFFVPVLFIFPWRYGAVLSHFQRILQDNNHPFYCIDLRYAFVLHALYGVTDIFFGFFGAAAMMLPWRWAPVYREAAACLDRDANEAYSWDARVCLVKNAFLTVCDVFVIPIGVFAMVLAPWRVGSVYAHYKECLEHQANDPYSEELRYAMISEFFLSFFDLFLVPLGIMAALLPWRTVPVFRQYKRLLDEDRSHYCTELRFAFVKNFFLGFVDVALIPFALFGMVLPWRWYPVFHLFNRRMQVETDYDEEIRSALFFNAFYCVVDVFIFPFGVMAMLLPWRTITVYHHYRQCLEQDANDSFYCSELRGAAVLNFIWACLDVIAAPFMFLALALPWRTMAVHRSYMQCIERDDANSHYCMELRLIAVAQTILGLLDLFIAPFALVAFALPWRTIPVWNELHAILAADNSESMYCGALRWACIYNAVYALQDLFILPFGTLAMVLPWRTKAVYYHYQSCLQNDPDPYYCFSLRGAAFSNFLYACLDLLMTPFFAFALAAPWRTYSVLQHFHHCIANDPPNTFYSTSLREAAFSNSLYTLLDILLIPFLALALILPWRTLSVIQHMRECLAAESADSFYCVSMRHAVLENAAYAVMDFFIVPCGVVGIILPWRTLPVWEHYQSCLEPGSVELQQLHQGHICLPLRWAMLCNFFYALIDMLMVPIGVFACVVPVWRTYYVLQHYRYRVANADRSLDDSRYYCVELRFAFLTEFFRMIVDFLLVPIGIIACVVPVWRTYHAIQHYMWRLAENERAESEETRFYCVDLRFAFIEEFFRMVLDLLLVPVGVTACVFPLWRSYFVILHYQACLAANERLEDESRFYCLELRVAFVKEFFHLCIDVFLVPLGMLALCMPWRTYFTIKAYQAAASNADFAPDVHVYDYNSELRFEFVRQLCIAFFDVLVAPFFFVTSFSLIRSVTLFNALKAALEPTWNQPHIYVIDARWAVFEHFFRLIFDLFTFPFYLAVFVTVYRFPRLNRVLAHTEGFDRHFAILSEFVQLVLDLPFIFMLAVLTCCLWRVPILWRSRLYHRDMDEDHDCFDDRSWRYRVLLQLGYALLNLFRFPLFVLAACSILRTIPVIRNFFLALRHYGQPVRPGIDKLLDVEFIEIVSSELLQFAFDLWYLLLFTMTCLIQPLRGIQLIVRLLEPVRKWRLRLAVEFQQLLAICNLKYAEYMRAIEDVGGMALKSGVHEDDALLAYLRFYLAEDGEVGRFILPDWSEAAQEMINVCVNIRHNSDTGNIRALEREAIGAFELVCGNRRFECCQCCDAFESFPQHHLANSHQQQLRPAQQNFEHQLVNQDDADEIVHPGLQPVHSHAPSAVGVHIGAHAANADDFENEGSRSRPGSLNGDMSASLLINNNPLFNSNPLFNHIQVPQQSQHVVDIPVQRVVQPLEDPIPEPVPDRRQSSFDVEHPQIADVAEPRQPLPNVYLADEVTNRIRENFDGILAHQQAAMVVAYEKVCLNADLALDRIPYHHYQTMRTRLQENSDRLIEHSNRLELAISNDFDELNTEFERIHPDCCSPMNCICCGFGSSPMSSYSILNPWRRTLDQTHHIITHHLKLAFEDWLVFFQISLVVCTIFRMPSMVIRYFQSGFSYFSFKRAVANTLNELWLDFVMIIKLVIMTFTLIRAFHVWGNLITYWLWGDSMLPNSINGTRFLVDSHFTRFLGQFGGRCRYIYEWLARALSNCDCDVFVRALSTLIAGIIVPIVMVHEVFFVLLRSTCQRRILSTFAFLFWAAMFVLPLVICYYFAPNSVTHDAKTDLYTVSLSSIQSWLVIFFVLLLIYLAMSLVATWYMGDPLARKISRPSRQVVSNFQNVSATACIVLDALLMMAMPLVLLTNWSTNTVETGSTWLNWVVKVARAIMLFETDHFTISFALGIALVIFWYFLMTSPVVAQVSPFGRNERDEEVQRQFNDHFSNPLYIALVRFVSQSAYLPILVLLLKMLQCQNSATGDAVMVSDPSQVCWHGSRHTSLAAFTMYCVFFYIITAGTYGSSLDFGKSRAGSSEESWDSLEGLDIKFAPMYNMVFNLMKLLLIACVYVLGAQQPNAVAFICLAVSVLMFVWTWFYPRWMSLEEVDPNQPVDVARHPQLAAAAAAATAAAAGGGDNPGDAAAVNAAAPQGAVKLVNPDVSCIPGATVVRLSSFALTAIASIITMAQLSRGSNSSSSVDFGQVIIAAIGIIGILGFVVWRYFTHWVRSALADEEVSAAKQRMLSLIQNQISDEMMTDVLKQTLVFEVNQATMPLEFCKVMHTIESHLPFYAFTRRFFLARIEWLESLEGNAARNFETLAECVRALETALRESADQRAVALALQEADEAEHAARHALDGAQPGGGGGDDDADDASGPGAAASSSVSFSSSSASASSSSSSFRAHADDGRYPILVDRPDYENPSCVLAVEDDADDNADDPDALLAAILADGGQVDPQVLREIENAAEQARRKKAEKQQQRQQQMQQSSSSSSSSYSSSSSSSSSSNSRNNQYSSNSNHRSSLPHHSNAVAAAVVPAAGPVVPLREQIAARLRLAIPERAPLQQQQQQQDVHRIEFMRGLFDVVQESVRRWRSQLSEIQRIR